MFVQRPVSEKAGGVRGAGPVLRPLIAGIVAVVLSQAIEPFDQKGIDVVTTIGVAVMLNMVVRFTVVEIIAVVFDGGVTDPVLLPGTRVEIAQSAISSNVV